MSASLETTMDKIPFFQGSELVLGLAAPVGVDLDEIESKLRKFIPHYQYEPFVIRLSALISEFPGMKEIIHEEGSWFDKIFSLMEAGNEIRSKNITGDHAIIAGLAIYEIWERRKGQLSTDEIEEMNSQYLKPLRRTVHILRSLKHSEEVTLLRRVYGDGFFLIGFSGSDRSKKHHLEHDLHLTSQQAEELIKKDESEEMEFGQHTRDVFQLADGFIDMDSSDWDGQLKRLLDLIFGSHERTPTKNEYAMFMAFAASLRSGDLSRQVGAVIANESGDILSVGANDAPKFRGGLYWEDDAEKARDLDKRSDSNEDQKRELMAEIQKEFAIPDMSPEEQQKRFKKTKLLDITEYGRAVHAEMEALLACARNGVSPRGAILFCTTFPCHNCAKHLVAAGISTVFYVEPYPKSKAEELHGDSIVLGVMKHVRGQQSKVQFKPYVGVAARRFMDLFSLRLSRGIPLDRKKDGKYVAWDCTHAQVRVPITPDSYIELETRIGIHLKQIRENFNAKP